MSTTRPPSRSLPPLVHVDGGRAWGGGQVQLLGLVQEQLARGLQVKLIAQAGGALAQRCAQEGVPCEEMELRGARSARSFLRLVQCLRAGPAALVHIHDSASQAVASAAARRVGARVVVSRQTLRPVRAGLGRSKYAWCDRVICISEEVRRTCLAAGLPPSRLEVIPNFVDSAHFSPAPLPEAPTVVAVGRLTKEKGHAVLVAAMQEVVGNLPNARLRIYGEGPERAALEAQLAGTPLAGQSVLAGFVADVRPALAQAAVVAMPSLSEGLGVAVLEAMAMARPVVASDVGGLPESVVPGETGLLVPAGDPAALAAALLSLLRDRERAQRMGEAGRRRVLAHFDRACVVDRVLALYQDVLAGEPVCPD